MTIDWLSRATRKAGYGDAQQVKVLVEPDDGVETHMVGGGSVFLSNNKNNLQ